MLLRQPRKNRFYCPRYAGLVLALPWLVAAMMSCSGSSSSGGSANDGAGAGAGKVVSQASTGSYTPFTPRSQTSATVVYSPGAEAVVPVWKSKVTFPDGAASSNVTLSLSLIAGTIDQTQDLQILSPLMVFRATGGGGVLERRSLQKNIKVETIVDRFLEANNAVVLLFLNFGTSDQVSYELLPEDVGFSIQGDNSRLVSFETRDTDFAFVVAGSTSGAVTKPYARYPGIPKDSTGLNSSAKVDDVASQVKLNWSPATGSRTGYLLTTSYSPIATSGCLNGMALDNAKITSSRIDFPIKIYTDSYLVKSLSPGKTVYFQLCSVNSRTPPDISAGISTSYDVPERVTARLSGVPLDPTNASALAITVGGTGVVSYKYALLTGATDCKNATYGKDWIPVATPISDTLSGDGAKLLCVLGKKSASNVQVDPTQYYFRLDQTPPVLTSLDLINDAADSFLNAAEHAKTFALVSLQASGYDYSYFKIVDSQTTCDAAVTYGENGVVPADNSSDLSADGSYKVCVKLADLAGNIVYGGSKTFTYDATAPVLTAITLANEAADGYINAADHLLANSLISVTGTGFTHSYYRLTTAATTCDANITYGADGVIPNDASSDFGADGNYHVCVELVDDAGNPTFGTSATIILKQALPAFTSIALANDAADTYINLAESSHTTAIVGSLTGANYDTAMYAVVTAATTCNAAVTYGAAVPKSNDPGFTADGAYKVCIKLSDNALNPTVYGASATINLKKTLPSFTSVALANDAADNYLNLAETAHTTAIVAAPVGASYNSVGYVVKSVGTTCNGALTYSASAPQSNDAGFTADGDYIVCVRLSDNAQNPSAYGSSSTVHLKKTQIAFTSINLANAAADGYINAAEHALSTALVGGLVGTAYDTASYALTNGACNGGLSYGAVPTADDPGFTGDGAYKVCVKLSDNAGNPVVIGSSSTITLATTAPAAPHITAPTVASTLKTNTPAVTWTSVVGAASYDVLLSTASDCSSPAQTINVVGTSTTAAILADGTWYLCVSAKDVAGNATAADNNQLSFSVTTGAWSALNTGPSARYGATAIWDSVNSRLIVWGGTDGGTYFYTGSQYDPVGDSWTATSTGANVPSIGRTQHTAVWTSSEMIVWGGYKSGWGVIQDGAIYTPGNPGTWASMDSSGPAIKQATAIWTGAKMVVWGGDDGVGLKNTGQIYDRGGNSWSPVSTGAHVPSARTGHTAVWDNARGNMIVWGGFDGANRLSDGGLYNVAGDSWTTPAASGLTGREGHTAVWTSGAKMIVFGGFDGTAYLGDGAIYDAASDTWTSLPALGAPSARRDHVAIWDSLHSQMIIWGGRDGSGALATGAIYDLGSNKWTTPAINAASAPTARSQAVGAWTGTAALIFGGYDGVAAVGSGSRLTPP